MSTIIALAYSSQTSSTINHSSSNFRVTISRDTVYRKESIEIFLFQCSSPFSSIFVAILSSEEKSTFSFRIYRRSFLNERRIELPEKSVIDSMRFYDPSM